MATKIIAASLSVDTGNSNPSIKELKTNVSALNKEFESAKVGSTEQAASFKKLKDAQDQLAKSTEAANTQYKATSKHFENIKEGLSNTSGPLKTASEGVTSLSSAFKALLANPVVLVITAIVGALAFLYKAFTNTREGGEKMEQVFAGISAAAHVVLDRIFEIGGAIIKFFSGDFKGAFEQASKAITGIGDAIVGTYNKVTDLTAKLQQIRKEQSADDLDRAKRETKLALLRESLNDDSVPLAKKRQAAKELRDEQEKNAVDDLDRAKRKADADIALLSLTTNDVKKNAEKINEINIGVEKTKTENALEGVRTNKVIRNLEKQDIAERKAEAAAAAAELKKNREQSEAFNSQLRKLTQENALAGITDQYKKEKQLLENKIEDEQAAIKKEFADGKITRAQFNQLEIAQTESANIQRAGLEEKHRKELSDKEVKFQTELADLKAKATADGNITARQKEQIQLDIDHQKDLAKAAVDYKDNADQLFQIKQAIDAEFKAKQEALDEKNRQADAKKKLDDSKKHTGTVLSDPKSSYKARQEAIDAEQAQFKDALDHKQITESEYNDEVEHLAQARVKIKQEEQKQQSQINNAIGDAFNTLADIAGKNTAAGKALAVAGTTIKTIQGAADALFGMIETIPGPVGIALGVVAAAGVFASGVKSVQSILAVPIPGQPSAGGSAPSGISLPTAPVAPKQSSTKLDQSSINQIGLQKTQPVQAFVTESSNAASVTRAARLQGASVLGGN